MFLALVMAQGDGSMDYIEKLKQRRSSIASDWLQRTLATYPADAGVFFSKVKDKFTNPVGARLSEGIESLVDKVLSDADARDLCDSLEPLMQLRAIQDFTPARAVGFVFYLKDSLEKELAGDLHEPKAIADLLELESRIDQLALFAFDIYTKYKQKTYEIRVEEIKRSMAGVMRRTGMFVFDEENNTSDTRDM